MKENCLSRMSAVRFKEKGKNIDSQMRKQNRVSCSSQVVGSQEQGINCGPTGLQDCRPESPAGMWVKAWSSSPANSRPSSPSALNVRNKWINLYGNSK